ncbi:MAG: hypothetical protein ACK5MD_02420 [Flavobacteriales bacterium]
MQLKPGYIELKNSFNNTKIELIDKNAIYYYHRENTNIDMEFNKMIRFFEKGQYAYFSQSEKPIVHLSYESIDYNNLEKASYAGYYNIKDSIIVLEKPNHLFRRSGKRNLDKYKVLLNGDLESITKQASDYGAVYKKIPLSEKSLIEVVPDW